MFARNPLGHTMTTPEAQQQRWPAAAIPPEKANLRRLGTMAGALVILLLAASPIVAQSRGMEKIRLQVNSYRINATVDPEHHHLSARAEVNFTATEDLSIAIFELHNGLRASKVTDAEGHPMQVERVSQDSTVRVPLPNGLPKGQSMTLIFDYTGDLVSADDSPVAGLKLASIADPTSYLLYAGRWFPVSGYGVNRFTSNIHVTVPQGYTVIGSGATTAESAASKTAGAQENFSFVWDKPSFPGTLIIGKFEETTVTGSIVPVHVFFPSGHKQEAQEYGDAAGKEFTYFHTLYGEPLSTNLKIVELPDDTVWSPGRRRW